MGSRKRFLFDTHINFVNRGSANDFLYRKMAFFVGVFWFSVTTYVLYVFRFITRYLLRFQGDDNSQKSDSNFYTVLPQEFNQVVSNVSEPEAEPEVINFENSDYDGFGEKETPKFHFKFEFQKLEDFCRRNGEAEAPIRTETAPTTSTSKYHFMPGKNISGFMEADTMSFTVKEIYLDSNDSYFNNKQFHTTQFLSERDLEKSNADTEAVHEKKPENSIDSLNREEEPQKQQSVRPIEDQLSEKEQLVHLENKLQGEEDLADEIKNLAENDFLASPESKSLSDEYLERNPLIDSLSDGFLSEKDFGEEMPSVISMECDGEYVELITKNIPIFEENHKLNSGNSNTKSIDEGSSSCQRSLGLEPEDYPELQVKSMEEGLYNSTDSNLKNSSAADEEIPSEKYFGEFEDESENEYSDEEDQESVDGSENFEGSNLQNPQVSDYEDSNELETLWEHQDLIEQLKDELRKVRATGLPTILEESESPKMMEDLKPWKIDEKFQHQDRMDELHKFYKSYNERMRKFDILNYQKMYAIGFLQLKDPLKTMSSRKSSSQTMTSLLSKNLLKWKRQRIEEEDPTIKFMRELQSDLEMVYVGQMCLSWEFLYWQYGKAKELQEADPHGFRQYNQVAEEFQQFQVLLQRFLENEPFQGPRIENYVKNRCILRNLLQVPVIKVDNLKDKRKARATLDDAISSAMLTAIIEGSMQTFWEFLRADKDETNVIIKGLRGGSQQVELQNPSDSELLMELRTSLQKKEKKLKDILRTGNCIVKKFQKHQEDRSNQTLYFFSQVDMRLVARVLNMSRITTDQLVWCHNKLNKLRFVDRKIHLEPSFLLFPC